MKQPRALLLAPETQIALGAAVWALFAAAVLWQTCALPGWDAYFHVRLADIMRHDGLILKSFPWVTESIWTDSFFDKDWLFHVYIIPFLGLGDMNGARTACVTLVFAAGISWGFLFKQLNVRHLFVVLLFTFFCAGAGFFSRLVLFRAHMISIVLLGLFLCLLLRRKGWLVACVCLVYSFAYTGSWQVLPIAVLFDLIRLGKSGGIKGLCLKELMTPWALGGLLIGLFVNPYFPHNLTGGVVQNIQVLWVKWFGLEEGVIINQGAELRPLGVKKLLTQFLPVVALLAVVLFKLRHPEDRRNAAPETLFLASLATIYFALTLVCLKFSDYSVPLIVAAGAACFKERFLDLPRRRLAAAAGLILIFGCCWTMNIITVTHRTDIPYSGAAQCLKERLSPGEVVFTGDWDDTPMLFFSAPEFKYLIFLEPYFMYVHSPRKYKQWWKITEGKAMRPAEMILTEFNSRMVLCPPDKPALRESLDKDRHATMIYTGPQGERLYQLTFSPQELRIIEEFKRRLPDPKLLRMRRPPLDLNPIL